MSKDKISQILKSSNDSKEISNLEHSPCFHPTMCFLNIITFHLLIVFGDLIWQCSKERSKFWLHEFNDLDPSWSKRFVWFLNTMIFQNGCSKDHILFQKKKKNILLQNLVLLNYVLTWSSMKEVRRQPFKGPVPITKITSENKVKTMWQNCLGAC